MCAGVEWGGDGDRCKAHISFMRTGVLLTVTTVAVCLCLPASDDVELHVLGCRLAF